jgi:hypothetical protein
MQNGGNVFNSMIIDNVNAFVINDPDNEYKYTPLGLPYMPPPTRVQLRQLKAHKESNCAIQSLDKELTAAPTLSPTSIPGVFGSNGLHSTFPLRVSNADCS